MTCKKFKNLAEWKKQRSQCVSLRNKSARVKVAEPEKKKIVSQRDIIFERKEHLSVTCNNAERNGMDFGDLNLNECRRQAGSEFKICIESRALCTCQKTLEQSSESTSWDNSEWV